MNSPLVSARIIKKYAYVLQESQFGLEFMKSVNEMVINTVHKPKKITYNKGKKQASKVTSVDKPW